MTQASEGSECMKLLLGLLDKLGFIVVYGEAGAGKTSLALSVASQFKDDFLYLNTEGSPVGERALQVLGPNFKGLFIDVDSLDSLILHLTETISRMTPRLIVVDSLNSVYRVEAAFDVDIAHTKFSLANALLRWYCDRGVNILCTAQVSGIEQVPAGMDVIRFYAGGLLRLRRTERGVRLLESEDEKIIGRIIITEEGIKWLECTIS